MTDEAEIDQDEQDILNIIEVIQGHLAKNGNLAAARKHVQKFRYTEAQIEEAVRRLVATSDAFDNLEPHAIREPNQRWYHGPPANSPYWADYVSRLRAIGWSDPMIEDLNLATSKALDLMEPPGHPQIRTRGLVIGRVQSGKTGHFTGLIAKAADAGYKIFIVLSGITNSLRLQTQKRLARDLTNRPGSWYWLTKKEVFGDFEYQNEANVDLALKGHPHRSIAVVKKHSVVLRRLIDWLKCGNQLLNRDCPILIIDDEADQASLNTGKSMDMEELSKINDRIVELLSVFPKCGYVGYTATPFANVLTHPDFPDNLYPRSFLFPLEPPKEYFGAKRIHGTTRVTMDQADEETDGLPLLRAVPVAELPFLRPKSKKTADFRFAVTPHLDSALRYFFLATAARLFREAKGSRAMDFSTMLVHTSHRIEVHRQSEPRIDEAIQKMRREVKEGAFGIWEAIWKDEMAAIDRKKLDVKLGEVEFKDLVNHLFAAIDRCKIIVSNSMKDEETNVTFDEKGQIAIVIGGNTLSRGLTLDGLVVSFFVRSANAYDTILQMGRWFGYRPYYEDLPRIWMTEEMQGHFHDLATIEEEFREELDGYRAQGLTPMQAAMRIRQLPKIRITAANKMRFAVRADIGYGGARPQTIHFDPAASWLQANLDATKALVSSLGPTPLTEDGRHVWRSVPASSITAYLQAYRFHSRSRELDSDLLQRYIDKQNKAGGLNTWNVVVCGLPAERSGLGTIELAAGIRTNCINRSRLKSGDQSVVNIKALMSTPDILADQPDFKASRFEGKKTRELFALRRGDPSGVLLIYPVSKDSKPSEDPSKTRKALGIDTHMIGIALIFPEGRGQDINADYIQADLQPVTSEVSAEDEDEDEAVPSLEPAPGSEHG